MVNITVEWGIRGAHPCLIDITSMAKVSTSFYVTWNDPWHGSVQWQGRLFCCLDKAFSPSKNTIYNLMDLDRILTMDYEQDFGEIHQYSNQSLYYNSYDMEPPVLSTGKTENPCWSKMLSGNIKIAGGKLSRVRLQSAKARYDTIGYYTAVDGLFFIQGGYAYLINGLIIVYYTDPYESDYCNQQQILWRADSSLFRDDIWEGDEHIRSRNHTNIYFSREKSQWGTYRTYMYSDVGYYKINNMTVVTTLLDEFDLAVESQRDYFSYVDTLEDALAALQDIYDREYKWTTRYDGHLTNLDWAPVFTQNLDLRGGMDLNAIENLSSIDLDAIRAIPALLKRMRKGKDISKLPKTLSEVASVFSSAYLSKKYGLDNTIRDIQTILEYIETHGSCLCQPRKTVVKGYKNVSFSDGYSGYMCTKTVLKPRPGVKDDKLTAFTNTFGLEMTPSQLWATVPFSFAIDWIVQFGDLIANCDARAYALYNYELLYMLRTYRYEKEVEFSSTVSTISDLHFVVYDRCLSDQFPPANLNLEADNNLGSHIIEIGALIINSITS